jgi:hypothetical protein
MNWFQTGKRAQPAAALMCHVRLVVLHACMYCVRFSSTHACLHKSSKRHELQLALKLQQAGCCARKQYTTCSASSWHVTHQRLQRAVQEHVGLAYVSLWCVG